MKEEYMKGKGQFANLPQEVKIKEYPKFPMKTTGDLDDTMTNIDQVVEKGVSKKKKYESDQK